MLRGAPPAAGPTRTVVGRGTVGCGLNRDHWRCTGRGSYELHISGTYVLRQLCLPLQGVWALTSSELPWAVPDGPT